VVAGLFTSDRVEVSLFCFLLGALITCDRLFRCRVLVGEANPSGFSYTQSEYVARRLRRVLAGTCFDWCFARLWEETELGKESLREVLDRLRPRVFIFEGHGTPASPKGEVILCRGDSNGEPLPTPELIESFRPYVGACYLIVLDACETDDTARALALLVPYAIGWKGEPTNIACEAFCVGLMRRLADGYSVRGAFLRARDACQLMGLLGPDVFPVLAERRRRL
jgi:hypothetical protein